jgi:hypothetical protein
VVVCGANTYTVTEGTFSEVEHFGSSSGNTNGIETLTARNVVVVDQRGDSYRVVGVERFGGSANAQTGSSQETWVFKLRIVGTADSINVVVRFDPNGEVDFLDFGSCPLM